jgi:UDP-N-acetylmuramoylalanine--D-glutamate ligase
MRWRELTGRRVGVWGMGREGRAALALLERAGAAGIVTVDEREPVSVLEALAGVEVVIVSPGVSRYRPEVAALLARGVALTSLTHLLFAEREGRRMVGVTGTKGKSTTASLIHTLLVAAGVPAELGGNIGRPPSELLDAPDDTWLVLEVSSYQASGVAHSPEVGVLTELFPEHLDWHGSLERYVADKLTLFRSPQCGRLFVNGWSPGCIAETASSPNRVLVGTDDLPVAAADMQLLGIYNRRIACWSLAVAEHIAGRPLRGDPLVLDALRRFPPLPHRLETIGRLRGGRVVEDLLATAPQAVAVALEVFGDGPVVLLVGGQDRGVDYKPLATAIAQHPSPVRVVAHGEAGPRIAATVRSVAPTVPLVVTAGLDAAVAAAAAELDLAMAEGARSGGQASLLFSPGAPSYDQHVDYRARSEAFRAALSRLPGWAPRG